MKFYSIFWTFSLLCALSRISNAEKAWKDTLLELTTKICDHGQVPGLSSQCPFGAKDPRDCTTQVVCRAMAQRSEDWEKPRITSIQRRLQKTEDELNAELLSMECPKGKKPSMISPFCPSISRDVRDCPPTDVGCVQESWRDEKWEESEKLEWHGSKQRQSEEELQAEMLHKECPFGQRPAISKPYCPRLAREGINCPPHHVICVKDSYRNEAWEKKVTAWLSTTEQKSEAQLNSEMKLLNCPAGYVASKISSFCPSVSRDVIHCPNTDVGCVLKRKENLAWRPNAPGRPRAPNTPKSEDELNQELMNMKCLFGQRPAKVSPEPCPTGAREPGDCAPTEVWCVKESFSYDIGTTDSKQSEQTSQRASSLTEKDLEIHLKEEMKSMKCPRGQAATLITGPNPRLACRPDLHKDDPKALPKNEKKGVWTELFSIQLDTSSIVKSKRGSIFDRY